MLDARARARDIVGVVLNKLTEQEASYYCYDSYYGARPASRLETTKARQT